MVHARALAIETAQDLATVMDLARTIKIALSMARVGRKKKPETEKKQPVCIKLSPWVKSKLKAMNASKTVEEALIKFWGIDESL
jgi:hypothetical protein